MSEKTENRRGRILSLLRATRKEWQVEELASALDTRPLTIRRDLNDLAGSGAIIRTYGGCLVAERSASEYEYHQRVAHNFELKQAIGLAALDEIADGSTILINDGSTTFHLASNLSKFKRLVVYTNSLAMIAELGRMENVELYVLGGKYGRVSHTLDGSLTERSLEPLCFDAAFIGSDAISHEGKCLSHGADEARTTQIMLRQSRRKILLADHTKTEAKGSVAFASLADFDLWITSPGLSPKLLSSLSAMTKIRTARLVDS